MPDSNRPGDIPPDLPTEYAEAYRRGYERAYRQSSGGPDTGPDGGPDPRTDAEPDTRTDTGQHAGPDVEATSQLGRLHEAFRTVPAKEQPHHRTGTPRPPWFVPAVLVGLAVLLVIGAYGIGKVVSSQMAGSSAAEAPEPHVVLGDGSTTDGPTPPDDKNPQQGRYHGRAEAAPIAGATASCQSADGVDSGGHPVSYATSNLYDGDMTTAWRCDGSGVGKTIKIDLPEATEIGQVGLVPGYAKTDAESGVDRYAQNNRITKVRWILGNSGRFVQTFNGGADQRKMQTMRIPVTKADKLVIEILSTTPGPRNTTAISEVRVGRTTG